jgi:hypothetical protein
MLRDEQIILIGKPEGKGQLWRHRHGWEDIIKATMKKIGREEEVERIYVDYESV